MFFVSSILLVFMGVMGEYIGAIHTQIQRALCSRTGAGEF